MHIDGLQPICRDSNDNGMAAMLVVQMFCLCQPTWRRWRHLQTKNRGIFHYSYPEFQLSSLAYSLSIWPEHLQQLNPLTLFACYQLTPGVIMIIDHRKNRSANWWLIDNHMLESSKCYRFLLTIVCCVEFLIWVLFVAAQVSGDFLASAQITRGACVKFFWPISFLSPKQP